ncbi:hypothetical protein J2Z69_002849 [Paenibacillus shirakamiensis]|uniref:SLH domain-containing protein n=1 Tax=Paenibacillus shirakamiensis TaxID=1265935 RepID=A0ABS4JJB4_9BACL|nr:Ig-like domain-containing protein [Paenibacillus shirakamiensis]MBP2001793.1 hypothetical protein [Paenibacillus shirakamiensis]
MSNTSYTFKENSQTNHIQGGDKKVMKKILSVALSTAMAFSMFASVAFGAELSPQDKFDALKAKGIVVGYPDGQSHLEKTVTRGELAKIIVKTLGLKEVTGVYSFKDKNYDAKNWAVPYIEAAVAAKIVNGKDSVKKIFDFNGNVSVEELATILVRALKLEVPTTGVDNTATAWAKGYVQAAINAGYIEKTANFQGAASRSQVIVAAYAVDQKMNVTVTGTKVVDSSNVEFTLSNGEVVKVKLDKALVANVKTSVTFKDSKGNSFTTDVTYVVTAATKVVSATATNYKQLVVNFDGDVDTATAGKVENYKVSGVTFTSATLSSDKKSVTLLVAEDSASLPNQKEATLTVNGVKNADGTKTFNESVKFTAVDTTQPTVQSVTGLGTKAIKVVFSEPVTSATASNLANYKVDGKAVSGYIQYTYPNIAFITTDLPAGEHTLTVSNISDGTFKVATADTKFTIAEDKAAPEIASVTATDLYKVEVVFNEPVKSISKAYQTSTNRPATYVINDNKVTLTFSEPNRLGLGESTIYLDGVTDYSNNSADRNVKVTPVLDTTRPTVVGATAKANSTTKNTDITVEFSKNVNETDALKTENYVLRNEKGEVYAGTGFTTKGNPVVAPKFVTNSDSKVVISSIGNLPSGKYSLEISGIRDRAAIGNTLIPQKVEFTVTDTETVKANSAWVASEDDNYAVYVQFNKTIATSGAGNAIDINKYNYGAAKESTSTPFPTSSAVISQYNSNTVKISVPKADANTLDSAKAIRVVNVSDVNGNYVDGTPIDLDQENKATIAAVNDGFKAIAKNKATIQFKGELTLVDKNDFVFATLPENTTVNISNQTVDNGVTTVEFTFSKDVFNNDAKNITVSTKASDLKTSDSFGRKIAVFTNKSLSDKIAPAIVTTDALSAPAGKVLTVAYQESLNVYFTPKAFKVYVNGNLVTLGNAIQAGTDEKNVQLTLSADAAALKVGDRVEVYLENNASGKFVTDKAGNASADFFLTTVATAAN